MRCHRKAETNIYTNLIFLVSKSGSVDDFLQSHHGESKGIVNSAMTSIDATVRNFRIHRDIIEEEIGERHEVAPHDNNPGKNRGSPTEPIS